MLGLLLYVLVAADPSAPAAAPTAEQLKFFETNVRPVLVEHCQKCHGPAKQWGSLRVDSREALVRGGDSGAAVVPGDSKRSLLMRAVRHEIDELKMPAEGKLAARQIADLATWIDAGAAFPAGRPGATRSRDPNHWAFQPPRSVPLPAIASQDDVLSPVDAFILDRLHREQVEPARLADRRTWLRRATYDLTGLPPTPDEVREFLADEAPDAFDRLLDRLLASPAYGERWGRRWLDVARYADSNGLDENIAHGNAWRYRDYVVDAFNQDKPFDEFVREQLAGDLLVAAAPTDALSQARRHELMIATGFLSIGPKVLAEVNEAKMRMDLIDEQVDTTGRVFLGMTFGCARCHDHKFDPIDQTDYYGLAGVFKSTRTMDTYTKVARWHEHRLPSPEATALQAEYDGKLAAKKQQVATFTAEADKAVRAALPADAKPPEKLETLYPEATKTAVAKLREELAQLEKNPPDLPAAMGVTEDKTVDVALHVRGNPLKLGEVVPRRTPRVMNVAATVAFRPESSGRRELAEWLVDPRHPLTARVVVNRAWRWHFGRGLVASTENFGLLGERPSHPELLDWLAGRFVADGWSFKRLHRLLMTSGTYLRSSDATATERDPDNRLFGRAPLRRLEAEEVRDSLLAVGEQLDRRFGGTLLKVKNRGYLFDHTSIDLTDYTSARRSLYLPVIRNNVYDVFQLLDFPDPAVPSGDRVATTVAPQALLMLNGELVMKGADELAERAWREASTPDERLARVYAIVFLRPPTDQELAADRAFLAMAERAVPAAGEGAAAAETQAKQAWSALCQVLLASNEFLYVR